MSISLNIEINKQSYTLEIEEDTTLLSLLRDTLHLTGPKEGCGNGECGACSVMVDGTPVRSCIILAAEMEGRSITTIEGLTQTDEKGNVELSEIQKSFIDEGAVQCGFCTPGFVIATEALFNRKPNPGKEDIKEALSGHLCRCTGYKSIFSAVDKAAERKNK
ncbi:MAG: (2Fe-2S)-binding protein [Spirochaetales bacterium]|nr:(2Fe-2S)-binding protein [Spirochaetales bacterium]